MPPPIYTDAYIRKMCPENHPIPLAKIPTMGATKAPQYLAKGYTGIKYVPPPHRPPVTVNTLATMMAGTSNPEAVRAQVAVVENFLKMGEDVETEERAALNDLVGQVEVEVNNDGDAFDDEETKEETEAQEEKGETEAERQERIADNLANMRQEAIGGDLKRDSAQGAAAVQTAKGNSRRKKARVTEPDSPPQGASGGGPSRSQGGGQRLSFDEESNPPRKPRGPNPQTPDRRGMRAEDTRRAETRAAAKEIEKQKNIKKRLRVRGAETKPTTGRYNKY